MSVSSQFKTVIQNHLNQLAANDNLFAETLKKENKNINDCCTYILNQVQKSGQMGFADEEIFGMAVHYYDEDNIEVGGKINAKVVVNHHAEAPKQKAKQNKVEEQSKAVMSLFKPKAKKQEPSLSFEFPE
jgi:hypothetical protein